MTEESPMNWVPKISEDEIDDVLDKIMAEAQDHNGDYAAGMRHAASILESNTKQ